MALSSVEEKSHPASRTATLLEGDAAVGAAWEGKVGQRLGRYVIEERLGAGAMGVVLGARDPDLGRAVAIKVAHPSHARKERASARFVREARAMAALDHPHVVALYDFGVLELGAYLVMERVQAQTLGAWLATSPPAAERMRVMLEAGAGLAAAHEAGLVHRDFKPENVLITADGHAKVTDFGLARAYGDDEESTRSQERDVHPSGDMSLTVTAEGAVLGSPAYMSIEQHRAESLTPQSDQYSYCISLWEALAGRRPFDAKTVSGLLMRKLEGPGPAPGGVPHHVIRALRRGLAVEPDDRHASMNALLRALQRGRVRRTWWVAAAVATAALPLGLSAATPAETQTCELDDEHRRQFEQLAQIDTVRDVFARAPQPHLAQVGGRVTSILDGQVDAWVRAHAEACALDETTRDAAMLCLQRDRDELSAAANSVVSLRGLKLGGAVGKVSKLRDPRRCLESSGRAGAEPLGPRSEAFAKEAHRYREAAREALRVGDVAVARAELEQSVVAIREIQPAGARARPLTVVGDLFDTAGDPKAAREHLLAAFEIAREAENDLQAVGAALHLIWVEGVSLQNPDEGDRWGRQSEAFMQRTEIPQAMRVARLINLAGVKKVRGDLPGALELLQAARDVADPREADLTPAERNVQLMERSGLEHNIAAIHYWQGDHDAAITAFRRAVETMSTAQGTAHPDVVDSLEGVVYACEAKGDLACAEASALRIMRILEDSRGPDHHTLVRALTALAAVEYAKGDLQTVRERFERAIEIVDASSETSGDQRHVLGAELAAVLREQGDYEGARVLAEAAYAAFEAATDPELAEHRAVALRELAMIASTQGRHREAIDYLERTLVASADTGFWRDDALVITLTSVFVLTGAGELDRAVDATEEGLRLARENPRSIDAQLFFLHGIEALVARGETGDRAAAEALLEELEASLEGSTGTRAMVADELAEVRALLGR